MNPLGTGIHLQAIMRAAGVQPRHGEHVRDTLAQAFGVTGDVGWRTHIDAPRHGRIVICPHASAEYKEWPEDRWEAVLDAWPEAVVIPGPGRKLCGLPGLHADRDVLTRTIAGARLLIGVDSGPVHLADALGVPVIGLYAATSAVTYGPYNDPSRCIDRHRQATAELGLPYDSARHLRSGRAMHHISVDDVLGAIRD